MPLKKKAKAAWWEEVVQTFGIKGFHISVNENIVCKKLSDKTRKLLKESGYKVCVIPNGCFVVCHR